MKKATIFTGVSFLILAVVCIIFSIVCYVNAPSHANISGLGTTKYEYYGGDAYTGIQHAAADASNNSYASITHLRHISNLIGIIALLFFIVLALLFAIVGINRLIVASTMDEKNPPLPLQPIEQSEPQAECA